MIRQTVFFYVLQKSKLRLVAWLFSHELSSFDDTTLKIFNVRTLENFGSLLGQRTYLVEKIAFTA